MSALLEEAGKLKRNLVEHIKIKALTAQRLPQAMVKICSFAKGKTRAMSTLRYISRQGKLDVENEQGEILSGQDALWDELKQWSVDFGKRKNGRDTMHMVLSAPKDSNRKATLEAARSFCQKTYGAQGHRYLLVAHNDTKNPHVHVVVKMQSERGNKLNPRKENLHQWRLDFAKECRAEGIQVEASSRAARGVGKKSTKQPLYHLSRRGKIPRVNQHRILQATYEFQNKLTTPKPWEAAMQKRNQIERQKYAEAANIITKNAANTADASLVQKLNLLASQLQKFGREMPIAKTKRQLFIEHAKNKESEAEMGR